MELLSSSSSASLWWLISMGFVLLIVLSDSSAQLQQQQQCSTTFSFNSSQLSLSTCTALPAQGASLAWSFFPANRSLAVAFSSQAPSPSGWVAWGFNPSAQGMVGSSVLLAFHSPVNGSNLLPFKLTAEVQSLQDPLSCSPVDFSILSSSVQISASSFSFFASLLLPSNQTSLNHVWNKGPSVSSSFHPQEHSLAPDGLRGFQTIDMSTGQASPASSPPPGHPSLKRTHGIINTISWGILLPLGALVARYLRPFPSADPAWFYIHASVQTAGYVLGVAGWSLGMRLRSVSPQIHRSHQNIGFTLFALATLQILSLFLRPGKDRKVRKHWNVYHHFLGYTILLLGIINIFQGLNILQPAGGWRAGYSASLSLMAAVVLVLEAATWIRFLRQRK